MPRGSELQPDAESMRRLGYLVVDRLVEWNEQLAEGPAATRATRAELEQALGGPPPEGPSDPEALVRRLFADAIVYGQRTEHPRFMGYVPGAATWTAVLGGLVTTGCNVFGGSWLGNAGTTVLELTVLDWFKEWLGYPAAAEGLLTGGGSEANLLGVLCARSAILDDELDAAVAYVTDEAHSSVGRALRAAGLTGDRIRTLPTDERFRMSASVLADAVTADRAAGRRPFLTVATAGSTNTGAIDPLGDLRAVCDEHGMWLHVDAAYGGFFALTERGREALAGLELADSITLDPHKGLAQPWGTGCILVRREHGLSDAFRMTATYLRDARRYDDAVNLFDRGLQLTRPARAVPLWLSVQSVGLGQLRGVLDRAIDHARHVQRVVEAREDAELVTPASLGIVTFRRRDRRDEEAVQRVNASGLAHISTTLVDGEMTLRLCINSFRTTRADVDLVLEALLAPLAASGGGS
jgi:glutamate/tyrosine decarboxylase-like PLP-dependent enzyme